MIRIEEVSRRFNHFVALEDISLQVKNGESFALLGPNGAGKTTLVRIISTLLKPTSGKVLIDNIDVTVEPEEAKRRIGVVSHNPFLYDELTARENLEFFSRLYGCTPDIDKLLKDVDLARRAEDMVGTYSRGMKQRLSIARALLHDPPALILDEPTSGLDIASRENFYKHIANLKEKGKTFLLTTHYIEEAELLCTRGAVLNKGRVISEVDLRKGRKEVEKIFRGLVD